MAEWLEQVSQWHEMYCHDLKVMSSNPGQVELGVHSMSVLSCTWANIIFIPQQLNVRGYMSNMTPELNHCVHK